MTFRYGRISGLMFGICLLVLTGGEVQAACKFFTTCGFTPNRVVDSKVVADTNCMTVDNIPAVTDVDGCVTYRLCCVVMSCETNMAITVAGPAGQEVKTVDVGCTPCADATAAVEFFPTVIGCVPDICTAGGDTFADPIDITGCTETVPALSKLGVFTMASLVVLAACLVWVYRRSVRA